MSKFVMKFDLDNAVFHNDDGSINLEAVKATVRQQVGRINGMTHGSEIIDLNGLRVGWWEIHDDNSQKL